jgi:polyhydroxyalkanoate synthase
MFSFCNNQHKVYQEDYNRYVYIDQKLENHRLKSDKCEYNSHICNLWLFKSKQETKESFVVVPSLFNSPEILFFNQEQSYIDYLTSFGDVYLLEWKEAAGKLHLIDYAKSVEEVIKFACEQGAKNINLVGHCIGGNIAIFSTFIANNIASLTLLTTPWDYSHFTGALVLSETLEIRKVINGMASVPKIYVQMMFFMMFPNHYQAKIAKYFALDSALAREKYLRIEHWLASGIDIPASLYNEILDEIIIKNTLMKKDFYINNHQVSLDQIKVPTCIISAKDDQIAPPKSMLPLQKGIKQSKIIKVDGGHIGYLINDDQRFKEEYRGWLTQTKEQTI